MQWRRGAGVPSPLEVTSGKEDCGGPLEECQLVWLQKSGQNDLSEMFTASKGRKHR